MSEGTTKGAIKEIFTPLLVDTAGVCRLLGVKKSLLYSMISTGKLGPQPVVFNSKKLWSVEELQNWIRQNCPIRDAWLKINGK